MAQRHQLAGFAARVFTFAAPILGQTLLGSRVSGSEFGPHHR